MRGLNAAPVYFAPVTVVVVLPDWDIALAKAGGSRQPLTKLCAHLLSQIVQPPTSKHMAHITNSPTLCKKKTFLASPLLTHMLKEWLLPLHGLGTLWALTKGCTLVHFWFFKLTFASRFLSWWSQLSYLSVVFVVLKTGPLWWIQNTCEHKTAALSVVLVALCCSYTCTLSHELY